MQSAVQIINNHGKIDVAKALTLRLQRKLTFEEIASKFGVSRQAVQQALDKFNKFIESPENTAAYQDNKAQLLDTAQFKILNELLDSEKLEKASINNLAYAYSQLDQSARLERGQSTANIAYADYGRSLAELHTQRQALEQELGISDGIPVFEANPQDIGDASASLG